MFNDRFAQLIALKFSGEASEEQIRELQQLLEEDPNAEFFHGVFSDYWKLEKKDIDSDIQDEIHFQQIISIAEKGGAENNVIEPETWQPAKRNLFSFKNLLVAASLVTIAVLSYFLLQQNKVESLKPNSLNEVTATSGTRTRMTLPDGSNVWLNSESKLEYNTNFNGDLREVYLEGEAYFDVAKDKDHPFIVHTSDIDIKVLGTAFNVKSYPAESSIEATLIHGLIEVTNKKEPSSPKVILRPHDKLVYNKSFSKASQKDRKNGVMVKPYSITTLPKNINDSAIVETSWIYNKLIFDGETFREIATKMERWYNVKIEFRNEKAAKMRIHFEFKDESIEEALKALQTIEPFTYKIKRNEIEILER